MAVSKSQILLQQKCSVERCDRVTFANEDMCSFHLSMNQSPASSFRMKLNAWRIHHDFATRRNGDQGVRFSWQFLGPHGGVHSIDLLQFTPQTRYLIVDGRLHSVYNDFPKIKVTHMCCMLLLPCFSLSLIHSVIFSSPVLSVQILMISYQFMCWNAKFVQHKM